MTTNVKICGLTNVNDARVAAEAGADLLGFIFHSPSPRYLSPETARDIITALRTEFAQAPLCVGVFVNRSLEEVQHILNLCQLDAAQLHGEEPPHHLTALAGRAYKAFRPQSLADAEAQIAPYDAATTRHNTLPQFLIDAYHPTLYGGTGRVTDWTMAAAVAQRHPIMLAGSLTPDNIAEAIQTVQPWGVDVSSGVEQSKGQKDHAKLRAFIQHAKQTNL